MRKLENIELPVDHDLEKSVINGLLRRSKEYSDVAGILRLEAFNDLFLRDIYATIAHYAITGNTPSIREISDFLLKKPIWQEKGHRNVISEITEISKWIPEGTLKRNVAALMDVYFRREIMLICEKFHRGAGMNKHGLDMADSMNQAISGLTMGLSGPSEVLSWEKGEQVLKDLEIVQQAKQEKGITGIPTGSPTLDGEIGGLQNGQLVVVAAKTNVGKTPFMINMADAAQFHTGKPSAYFTLEVDNSLILKKLMARTSGVTVKDMVTGQIGQAGWTSLTGRGMTEYLKTKIIIDDTSGITVAELTRRARRLKAKYDIGTFFVDYLQLLSADKKGGTREQDIGMIAQSLKNLAKELNTPVIAASQLSRAVSQNNSAEVPQLHHLRESGNIEQAADTILFLYRPELYEINQITTRGAEYDTKNLTLVIVAKHRLGFAKIGIQDAIPMMYRVPERYEDCPQNNFVTNVFFNRMPYND